MAEQGAPAAPQLNSGGPPAEGSVPPNNSGQAIPAAEGSSQAPSPGPERPDLAAEVMRKRDAAALAKVMQQAREVEAQKAALAQQAPKLTALQRAEQYALEGDHVRATRAFYEAIHGPEKAQELFPKVYEDLTSSIVGVESASRATTRLQADLERQQRAIEEFRQQREQEQAEHAAWQAETRQERISQGVSFIDKQLQTAEATYPYLLAESDSPAQLVFEVMAEAIERDEEPPSLEEAAAQLNKYYQTIFERKKSRYQTLLAPQSASGAAQPGVPQSQNGTRSSLSNADAAAHLPDLRQPQPVMDREQSIDQAHRLLMERLRQK